jgi:2-pyrone-4,6-dicarboxylate lactonase
LGHPGKLADLPNAACPECVGPGWHLDLLLPGWLTLELVPVLGRLCVDFSLAHLGMFPVCEGSAAPGFRRQVDLVRGGERRCWVKLTGIYRISTAPGYPDVTPMIQAVAQAAPDRVIWGSDYRHLSFADQVGSAELFNLFAAWVPDRGLRERILVANPASCTNLREPFPRNTPDRCDLKSSRGVGRRRH